MGKTEKIILIILVIAIIIAGIAVLTDSRSDNVIVDDFKAPSFEGEAILGVPENVETSLRYSELAIKEGFVVSMCVDPIVEGSKATVYFTSDAENTVWVRLQLLDEKGNLLGESGVLRPGEYVAKIALTDVPKKDELVVAKILSYEVDTYYSQGSATAQVMLHIE